MIETIGALLGGGVLGVIVKAWRDTHVARLRREEHAEKTAERRGRREDDITRETALEDREDRRRMEHEVRELRDTVTRLSVDVARCEERHLVSEARERELTTELDLTRQLGDRQRAKIEEQDATIAKLDRDVSSLTTQLADMRDSFDAFVKTAMGVRSISEVPGE